MINPITNCDGCGACAWCVAQLPPLPGPPAMGAPHEAFDRTIAPPQEAAVGNVVPPHETAERDLAPPHEFDIPLVGGIATTEPVVTLTHEVPPAEYEVPVVPVAYPLDTIAPLGLEDQY